VLFVLARKSAVGVAAPKKFRPTPPKFFEEGSRGGRRKEGLAAAREHLDENHTRATARASARQHTRGIRPNIRLLLEIGGRRGDIEKCAGRLGPG